MAKCEIILNSIMTTCYIFQANYTRHKGHNIPENPRYKKKYIYFFNR